MADKYSPNIVIEKCQQAGLSFWTASKVALELQDRLHSRLGDEDLNLQITNSLKNFDQEAATQFETYHSIKVRTSKNVLESFDRSKITESLVKETRIPRAVAEEVAEDVENDIRRLQLKNVSTPLIREMVNATLLQKRLADVKARYSRVGLPVYDVKELIDNVKLRTPYELNEFFGNQMLAEYTLTRVLPQKISEAYYNSDIYIDSLEQFITCPRSMQNDLRPFFKEGVLVEDIIRTGPAKKADVAALHAVRVMLTSRNYVGRGAGIDFFNIFMAPYIRRKNKIEIMQICQGFLYELNKFHVNDGAYFINMDLKIPDFLKDKEAIGPGGKVVGKYSDYEEEAQKFLRFFLETMNKGDHSGTPFRRPDVCLKFYKNLDEKILGLIKRPCFLIKQIDKNQSVVYNDVISARDDSGLRTGVSQAISINMPKAAKLSRDEKSLYSSIEEQLETAKSIAIVKRDLMKRRLYKTKSLSFLSQFFDGSEYVKFDDFYYTVSFVGLPQACQIALNVREYDSSCVNLTERIVRFALRKFRDYKRTENLKFCLGENLEPEAIRRFANQNKSLGITQEPEPRIIPESYENREEAYKNLQPLFEGGMFFDINSQDLSKSKDFVFLRTKT